MTGFPPFSCPQCGRVVASLYRDAIHVTVGRRFQYAYLRRHRRPDGSPCPCDTTGPLARLIGSGRRR